jgi:hypothetical protein
LSPGVKSYEPKDNFNQVRFLGATPLEAVPRILDHIGAPLIGPGEPNQAIAKPLYTAILPPTPQNAPFPSTTELIQLTDKELQDEGVQPRPKDQLGTVAPPAAATQAPVTTTPPAKPDSALAGGQSTQAGPEAKPAPASPGSIVSAPARQVGFDEPIITRRTILLQTEVLQAQPAAATFVPSAIRKRFIGPEL